MQAIAKKKIDLNEAVFFLNDTINELKLVKPNT